MAAAAVVMAGAVAFTVPGAATASTASSAPQSAEKKVPGFTMPALTADSARARAAAAGSEWRLCMLLGGHTTLQLGSTGEGVRHLQCILNEVYRYVNVPMNGTFEAVTEASVRHFQQVFSIPITGVVDTTTWAALHP